MNTSEISELGDKVYNTRDINPSQIGITSRQINYWVENELTPFFEKQSDEGKGKSSKKWIRLTLVQAVWVCIVKELLSFGVSVERLKLLAHSIWEKPRQDKYADEVFNYHIKHNKLGLSEAEINDLKTKLKDEFLMQYEYRTLINPFTDMIKSALISEGLPHSILYVPATNDYVFSVGGDLLKLELGSAFLEHPMISIPIIPIISKVFDAEFGNKKKTLSYLNEIEKQIRDIVVFKKPKVVTIAFEDEHLETITISEKHKTREQLSRYILENKIAKGSKLLIEIRSQDNYKLTLIKK